MFFSPGTNRDLLYCAWQDCSIYKTDELIKTATKVCSSRIRGAASQFFSHKPLIEKFKN